MPGKKAESPLSQMRTAAPCQQSWDTMSGNDQVRFCSTCYKNVYRFSHLNRAQAIQLVTANEGRACVTYYRRADGSVMAEECPVGLRRVQRPFHYARVALAAMPLAVPLLFTVLLGVSKLVGLPTHQEAGGDGLLVPMLRTMQPFRTIAEIIDPTPPIGDASANPSGYYPLPVTPTLAYDLLPAPQQVPVLKADGYRMTLRKPLVMAVPHPPVPPSAVAPTRQDEGHVAP